MRTILGWGAVVGLLVLGGCSSEGGAYTVPTPSTSAAFGSEPYLPPAAIDCNLGDDDMPTERAARPETFWAQDTEVRAVLTRVLGRISKATGLRLSVLDGGLEVVRVDLPPGYAGHAGPFIELDSNFTGAAFEAVLLHEIGHELGAGHLGPWEGVMSRCSENQSPLLTAADLEQICSAAPCTTFVPEVPVTVEP